MSPSTTSRLSLTLLGVLTTLLGVQACSSDDATGTALGAAFTIDVGASALALETGASVSTPVKATRKNGFASAIAYTVTGAPQGLTATVVSTTVADSSTLTINAAATLAAGTYPVVVTGAAPGAIDQQSTVTVTVTAPAGPPLIKAVATGAHTCALTAAGAAYCWGFNGNGQLGNNDSAVVVATPVAVVGGLTFNSIAVSGSEPVTCGVTGDGAAYCWGVNLSGQIGDGTTSLIRLTPTPVAGGLKFRTVALGSAHACALAVDDTAYCWGFSVSGALGDGSTGTHLTPAVAAPGMKFKSIVTGADHTCGLTPDGAAFCWGNGLAGQLGTGGTTGSTTPVAVSGGLTFQMIVAGGGTTCGLTAAGKAYCWGSNFFGQIGDGSSATTDGITRRLVPTAVSGGLTFRSLSLGFLTACGLTPAGAGYCWGYNQSGVVGDGTFTDRPTPVPVAGGLVFQSIAAGSGVSCGITTASTTYCWGESENGDLGDGTTAARPTPGPVRFR